MMKQSMLFRRLLPALGLLLLSGCGQKEQAAAPLPDVLKDQTFVYDQLETGEGTALYTLRFTENGYLLNRDGGAGILSSGTVQAGDDRMLTFSDQDLTQGAYVGSAFEAPGVELRLKDQAMHFSPATETTEYVYLAYLGTFSGKIQGKDAVLVLERWREWYLYTDGELRTGHYEIYADGTLRLTEADGTELDAHIQKGDGAFDLEQVTITLTLDGDAAAFSYCQPLEEYDATHAMGTYTLSLYPADVFEIHGVDGFLKAFGTLKGGMVDYFERPITDRVEKAYRFAVAQDGDTYYFPATTPLLPRSGNISKETGFGAYWNAGTQLEFILLAAGLPPATELFAPGTVSGKNRLPEYDGGLDAVMPSLGTARPLVLLIDFPDQCRPRHVTARQMEEKLFSLEEPTSLSAYYYRSSYGKLTIDGTVLDWYRMQQPRGMYDSDQEIMREALEHFIAQGLRLEDYDADGDGNVDALYVLWAGNLESGGIWDGAYRSTWDSAPEEWSRQVTGYIFVPGSTIWSSVPPLRCNTNSLTHETGHLLGLNDYYSYDTAQRLGRDGTAYTGGAMEGGLGGMDMMDTNIGDHNLFSKWLLGWADPTVIEYEELASLDGVQIRIRPSALAGDGVFLGLRPADSIYTEWLVIEAVAPALNFGEFTRLTGPVVRIMHVDSTLAEPGYQGGWRGFGFQYDNSYTSTKFISILEADGRDQVLNFVPEKAGEKLSYEESDYFHVGDQLTPDTYPNTNAYDAYGNATIPTGISIHIEEIAQDGTATIRLGYQALGDRLQLLDVTPKPQAVPYLEKQTIDAQTRTLQFVYDRALCWADSDAANQICVYSSLKPVAGVQAELDGNTLTLRLPELSPNTDYTAVIPANILQDATGAARNNWNGIYGFLTEP